MIGTKVARIGTFAGALALAGLLTSMGVRAQDVAAPTVDADGTIHTVPITIPTSSFLSPEGKAALAAFLNQAKANNAPGVKPTLATLREKTEERAKASFDRWLTIFPSTIEDTMIDGVHVFIVTPKDGIDPKNKNRVLIGAHQGGFVMGSKYSALVEAVPMAGRGRIKVIAVDYRMAPEFVFPAASEDMEAVYRHVLKTAKPADVGIFGCSAGGSLVAESVARFQTKGLPRPGAAMIMCSGAMKTLWFGGDADSTAALLGGTLPRPASASSTPPAAQRGYFDGADLMDPLVAPGEHPDVLAKFPPTMVVTGTRDIAMGNAIITHTALLKSGVHAELFVQEGVGHGHFYVLAGTPEALTAYGVFWKFFDTYLGR